MAEGPPLIVALLIANTYFEFGSFALECLAFLPVWWVLGVAYDLLRRAFVVVRTPPVRTEREG